MRVLGQMRDKLRLNAAFVQVLAPARNQRCSGSNQLSLQPCCRWDRLSHLHTGHYLFKWVLQITRCPGCQLCDPEP